VQERETKTTICMRRVIEGKMKENKTYIDKYLQNNNRMEKILAHCYSMVKYQM
jgi:hypothetical protein